MKNYHRLLAIPLSVMMFMSVKGGASSVVNSIQDSLLDAVSGKPALADAVDPEPEFRVLHDYQVLIDMFTMYEANGDPITKPEVEPILWDAPRAPDEFWDKLAYCETRIDRTHPLGNWQNTGRFAGGLGIMNAGTFEKGMLGGEWGTWERFGGEEFAPSPDKATREQQIIVANRIATEGWETIFIRPTEWAKTKGVPIEYHYKKEPVGFGGWGALPCAGGRPKTYYRADLTPVPTYTYQWGEESKNVHDLRGILGLKQKGSYNSEVRRTHLRWLRERNLSTAGVPAIP